MAAGLVHKFPKSFIFGTATAAYQIEGAVQEDGRGESIWDRFCHTPDKIKNGDTGDVACDHYHRYAEDIALMKDLGVGAYRFSIAWPRIIPDGEGTVNQKGLDWYARLVDKLLAAGIVPFVTLYHWDLPQALEEKYGGWRSRKIPEAFRRYAEVVVAALGDRVRHWITLNEMPGFVVAGYGLGIHAPGAKESRQVLTQIQHHALLAHGYGVRAVRSHGGRRAQVGVAHNARAFVPAIETAADIAAARKGFVFDNGPMLDPLLRGHYPQPWLAALGKDGPQVAAGDLEIIAAPMDFFGINCYSGVFVRAPRQHETAPAAPLKIEEATPSLAAPSTPEDGFVVVPKPKDYPVACDGWVPVMPQAIYWAVRLCHEEYGVKATYITENGCSVTDEPTGEEVQDTDRTEFYRLYLGAAARAVAEGYPLKGYFAWSLLDNFEWAAGYTCRFGLYRNNFVTQRRTAKLSAKFYAACIKARQVL